MTDSPDYLTVPALAGPSVHHAFFTRRGGVSTGIYDSLNVGYGSRDDPLAVAENRARAMACLALPADALVTLYQVHSPDVVTVDEPWAEGRAPRADALVTTRPGIALGILTADCAPVLLVDRAAGVIGAAHAGWRGALGGVLEAVVGAMVDLGAEADRIHAAVGPCIGPDSYEVGADFPLPFRAREEGRFFRPAPRPGHHLFDLPGYVRYRLGRSGVATALLGRDTLAEPDRFFSYRRSCLRKDGDYGRMLSAIVLE